MSFQQGLSGLGVSSAALDAIGNNVSNAGTVGFKSSRGEFADVFAASLTGGGASNIGIGAALASVSQQFTQGNITSTNNALDVAVNGGGFFRISNNGAISYSRNGQFQIDKSGFVVNAAGYRLQGYQAIYTNDPSGIIVQSTPTDIFIDPTDIQPKTTGTVNVGLNLDSRLTDPTVATFDASNPLSYNSSTSVTVYDSLGNTHVMSMYFIYDSTPTTSGAGNNGPLYAAGGAASTWYVRYALDGDANPTTAGGHDPSATTYITAGDNMRLEFDRNGKLVGVNGAAATRTSIGFDLAQVVGATNKATTPMTLTAPTSGIDFGSSTQFGSPFGVNNMVQDGFSSGRLAGIAISSDGVIQGRYSNGQSKKMGQIVLAKFNNPNGLQSIGGNQWQESSASGAPIIGAPGTGANGVIQSAAVEESNVDLTAELVGMITQQRAYQANAQTIKTQDAILQTLVNLR
ncbi:MAG: flagellar hook protein FlgE [Candidatus Nitricoxidivorans perseverans]|uniref:Flagellar hook protein FlgE n=1 Tax=Candidatus Nitricoxidivorans perseverans TaxID=2975601 RepID=A0AA49FMR4_9PROT|nr:MAG: flagellar hook protein FlgE [Candidatus Nitricoxidivorans perseverans]